MKTTLLENESGLPDLTGTYRQIVDATEIREKMINFLETAYQRSVEIGAIEPGFSSPEELKTRREAIDYIKTETEAAFWLHNCNIGRVQDYVFEYQDRLAEGKDPRPVYARPRKIKW